MEERKGLIFKGFSKIPRLSRECVVTEKIDGTNGQIVIINQEDLMNLFEEDHEYENFVDTFCLHTTPDNPYEVKDTLMIFAGSKNRWINIENDNYGFAKWVQENAHSLLELGEGRHYGEWWGCGIQRNYGLKEKKFSLFNVKKWGEKRPSCCDVVPVLFKGDFNTTYIEIVMDNLRSQGSFVAPGFMKPEGIVIYHLASGTLFKKTLKNDQKPKGLVDESNS